jgi:hypothetical protein
MSAVRYTPNLERLTFRAAPAARFRHLCPPGQDLADWCEEKVAPVRAQPTEVGVNQLALLLQDQFIARLASAPRAHHTLGSPKHCCIATVYISYARELVELRWKISPPVVREPAPASSAGQGQEPQFQGIYLGEDLGRASLP